MIFYFNEEQLKNADNLNKIHSLLRFLFYQNAPGTKVQSQSNSKVDDYHFLANDLTIFGHFFNCYISKFLF